MGDTGEVVAGTINMLDSGVYKEKQVPVLGRAQSYDHEILCRYNKTVAADHAARWPAHRRL